MSAQVVVQLEVAEARHLLALARRATPTSAEEVEVLTRLSVLVATALAQAQPAAPFVVGGPTRYRSPAGWHPWDDERTEP